MHSSSTTTQEVADLTASRTEQWLAGTQSIHSILYLEELVLPVDHNKTIRLYREHRLRTIEGYSSTYIVSCLKKEPNICSIPLDS